MADLTDEMESRMNGFIDEVKQLGGGDSFLKGLHTGMESRYFDEIIEQMNWDRQQRIDKGEKIVVGLNKYTSEDEVTPRAFKVPAELSLYRTL